MLAIRKALGAALAVNTSVFVVEAAAGAHAHSLSLLVDAVHNFSDELALAFLFLAYLVTASASRGLQRSANFLNSLGLIVIAGLILWQAFERLNHPAEVIGWLPIVVGLLAAGGNWAVARVLRPWQEHNPAIRLAYLHNMADVYVCFSPVLAGLLITVSGLSVFDPILAAVVAVWLILSTLVELRRSRDTLWWPTDVGPRSEDRPAA